MSQSNPTSPFQNSTKNDLFQPKAILAHYKLPRHPSYHPKSNSFHSNSLNSFYPNSITSR
ncbi:hypothetical protein HanRHA438_Chr08g0362191 [Helianthus annuus]|nr:hypothetical protein HanRHA438_Chr08g0362191 [Helianthus annuus]